MSYFRSRPFVTGSYTQSSAQLSSVDRDCCKFHDFISLYISSCRFCHLQLFPVTLLKDAQHRPFQELLFQTIVDWNHLSDQQVGAEILRNSASGPAGYTHSSPHSLPTTMVVTVGYCSVQIQIQRAA